MVTCFDGYEMTKQGRAGPALGMAAIASFIAGTLGVVGLMLVAPPLGRFALAFGPAEYFSLMVLGLTLVAYLGGDSLLKALLMAAVGLLLSTIGQDPVAGVERYTFDTLVLRDGIGLVPVFMGMFGIAEVLSTMEQPPDQQRLSAPKGLLPDAPGLARLGRAHRPRHGRRIPPRHPAGRRGDHRLHRLLRGGEAVRQESASGSGRGRSRGWPGPRPPTTPRPPAPSSPCSPWVSPPTWSWP